MRPNTRPGLWEAISVAIASAIIFAPYMVVAAEVELSPMPQPLAAALARRHFNDVSPMIGMLHDIAYVAFWGLVHTSVFHPWIPNEEDGTTVRLTAIL